MAVTLSNVTRISLGSKIGIVGTAAFTGTYTTGGESITRDVLGLGRTDFFIAQPEQGYDFEYDYTNQKLKVFNSAGFTPAGTNGTSAVTGTAAAQTFTPSATSGNLNLGTPAFSGTGLTAVGQDITTTDNQTMTLNQCAGMWLVPATGATPAVIILSNTAVTDAPAVFTVQGVAMTDAGAYKVVRVLTTGTNGASASLSATAAAQTFTGTAVAEAAQNQVDNGTDLTALTAVNFFVIGG